MTINYVRLTREDLYAKVWSTPVTALREEFGISDTALGKLCRRYCIPRPPRGYWQQLAAGKATNVEPLPPLQPDDTNVVLIPIRPVQATLRRAEPDVLARIANEKEPENAVTVADNLRNAHPLVREARQAYEHAPIDEHGRLWARRAQRVLDVRVSKAALHRTLRILDALLKAMAQRGYNVAIIDKDQTTAVIIGDERVAFHVSEKIQRIEREPAVRDQYGIRLYERRYDIQASGILTFHIDAYWPEGARKNWRDTPKRQLEDQLNDVIAGLIFVGEALRLRTKEHHEAEHRRRAAERQRLIAKQSQEAEAARRHELDLHAAHWAKSHRLREYLGACKTYFVRRSGQNECASDEAL